MEHTNQMPVVVDDLPESDPAFAPFAQKMQAEGLPEVAIRTFAHYFRQLAKGETGYISGQIAQPVQQIHDYEELYGYELVGQDVLERTVVIKLNGGLGTSMGMSGAKSLIEVKDGLTFLDILARQVMASNLRTNRQVPLLVMNSFTTQEATLKILRRYPELTGDIPVDFLQHKAPKVLVADLSPAQWPTDPEKEWCPPGHGDIYTAMVTSGVLDKLLAADYEYAFVSNSDNLGAMLDLRILGYMAELDIPFLMEVAFRTQADRKGGHLAQRPDGQFMLREIAQCPPEELDAFQDVTTYKFFNTNNLWIHLPSLKRILDAGAGVMGLPLIRNQKPVDPQDSTSPQVYQLETAMGSALSVIPGAQAIRVPRIRFLPVKKNNDLLVLWSDVYMLTKTYRLVMNPKRISGPPRRPPIVELDDRFYKNFNDMQSRFPSGPPSLVHCEHLRIVGDVYFGKDITVRGDVTIVNEGKEAMRIEDGAVIEQGILSNE